MQMQMQTGQIVAVQQQSLKPVIQTAVEVEAAVEKGEQMVAAEVETKSTVAKTKEKK
jgi:hypothetical protein